MGCRRRRLDEDASTADFAGFPLDELFNLDCIWSNFDMRHRENSLFSRVPTATIPRSVFNRSHCYKTTFDAGYLIPFLCDEVLPGDTFKCRVNMFARLTTPLVPIMDNLYLDVFFFFVPNRLLWSNWQKFCGEQDNPGDSTDFLVPQVESGAGASFAVNSLFDYMGCPIEKNNCKVSALWPRAYNLIWNEWFRDQNLQTSAVKNVGDGPDVPGNYPLRKRGKRHDYFTSALPWPQKGAGVQLAIGGEAVVKTKATNTFTGVQPELRMLNVAGTSPGATAGFHTPGAGDTSRMFQGGAYTGLVDTSAVYPANLFADLSTASAVTINSLRQAFQIQKLMERDARGGTRYIEIIRSHYGVVSPDARLQRPEYLGGGSAPVIINPVTQNSASIAGNPKGSLAAYGTAGSSDFGFHKSFVEHGVIIGLVMARADITYQQGLSRMWSRRTKYDFYWPALAHLGEQAILNKEIFFNNDANDDLVFGYQERWAEYRYFPSLITSIFRSQYVTPLDIWHLGQEFSALPVLGDTFIQEDPPIDRVVAVPAEPHFLFDSYFEISCARPMPVFSVPGLIDHF